MAVTIDGTTGVSLVQDGVVTADDMFSGFANGITEADIWHLTADLSLTTDTEAVLNANWSQANNTSQGSKGTGMTQSSGVFTFPSTGIWRVDFLNTFEKNGVVRQLQARIEVTDDNGSTWDIHSMGNASINYSGEDGYANANTTALVDVSNTSNVKVRFSAYSNDASSTLVGESSYMRTGAVFVRLGAT